MFSTTTIRIALIICIALGTGILRPGRAAAQTVPAAAAAPVPPALIAAKKVFISNAGGDSGLFPHPFTGSPQRSYDEFYAAMKQWARYELVTAPEDADLVLELQLIAPSGPAEPDKAKGATDPLPSFRLVIYDRASHYVLWALTSTIERGFVQKTHDRNFDNALSVLAEDLKKLVAGTPSGSS